MPINDIPVNDIPVNDVPVNEVPINDIPVNDIPVNEVPINDIPINEILLGGRPSTTSRSTTSPSRALIFTSGCRRTGTLGDERRVAEVRRHARRPPQRDAPAADLPDSVTLGSLTGGFGDTTTGDLIDALVSRPATRRRWRRSSG